MPAQDIRAVTRAFHPGADERFVTPEVAEGDVLPDREVFISRTLRNKRRTIPRRRNVIKVLAGKHIASAFFRNLIEDGVPRKRREAAVAEPLDVCPGRYAVPGEQCFG